MSHIEVSWTFEELVDPTHSAVIVVDMQNDFCSQQGKMCKVGRDVSLVSDMAPRLSKFLEEARNKGVTILYTQTIQTDLTLSPVWRRKMSEVLDLTAKSGRSEIRARRYFTWIRPVRQKVFRPLRA